MRGSDHVGLCWIIMRALVLTLSGWEVRVIGRFCTASDMKWLRVSKDSSGYWVACRLFKGSRQQ